MRKITPHKLAQFMLMAFLSINAAGCNRLPRIDPSGQRIFIPPASSNSGTYGTYPSTAVNNPAPATNRSCWDWLGCGTNGNNNFNPFYQRSYQAPYRLPSCPPSGVVPLTPIPKIPEAANLAVKPSLQLTPNRIVAPVGSEVILVAGLKQSKNLHDSGKPIHWMLSQESVGHFTDVGGPSSYLSLISHGKGKVDSPNFVISKTLLHDKTIDRGTELPGDDIRVLQGQSWISLSSASPGTSRVTALAPKIDNWPGRQRNATIYWVDAQWQFPQIASKRVGERALLTTTLSRQTTKMPIEGWTVRYELVGGPPANFIVNGRVADATAVEVKSDAAGRATAEIIPSSNQAGTAQVRMTVIRPNGDVLSNTEKLAMATGNTSVSWTAPELQVEIGAPSVAEVGSTVTYNIRITNRGDVAATGVMLNSRIPEQLAYVGSDQLGKLLGNRVEWSVGDIEARGYRQFQLNCQVRTPGQILNRVTATADGNLRSEQTATTQVAAKSIQLTMTGPERVTIGDTVTYQISIQNHSDQPVTGLAMKDVFDIGLTHAGGPSPLEHDLGTLGPGGLKEIGLTFTATQHGRHCHRLTVSADGNQSVVKDICVTIDPPAAVPQFTLKFESVAKKVQVGERTLFRVNVTNTGPIPLTNVRVTEIVDTTLNPFKSTINAQTNNRTFTWTIPRLLPTKFTVLEILCDCPTVTPQACNSVTVMCDQNVTLSQEACVEVVAIPRAALEAPPIIPPGASNGASDNTPNPGPPATQPSGQLTVTLTDSNEGVKPGELIEYVLTVQNNFDTADENVKIAVEFPVGIRFVKLTGNYRPQVGESDDGRVISIEPIGVLRRGETITFQIQTTATAVGRQEVKAFVESKLSPQAVIAKEDTTIFGQ